VPAMGVPEAPAAEAPAEGALLPAPAEVPNLPAQTADAPAEVPHLPAEGTSHLPGSAPVLAAEAPIAEGAPASTTPTQAGSIPVLGALP
jgi:hypothetical protein